jgi:hypothetical protein
VPAAETGDTAAPGEPVAAGDVSCDPAGQEFLDRADAAWAAEVERRILAGQLAGPPHSTEHYGDPPVLDQPDPADVEDPIRADDLLGNGLGDPAGQEFLDRADAAWAADLERRILAGEMHGPPVLDVIDGNPPEPDDPLPDGTPVTGAGWWASADRAVDDAGLAIRRAGEALGHAERMVRTAARADACDEAAWATGRTGRLTRAQDALAALAACTSEQRAQLGDLLDRTAGGGLADRPRLALTDALTGALLALTDLPALRRADRRGQDLRPPGPTDGYRPAAPLDRWVRARDRTCRFPGCRCRVPQAGELDHHQPYPDGPTSAANLAGYCTTDHRGKHQAPGWIHDLAPDGTLTLTTPSGITTITTPPPY